MINSVDIQNFSLDAAGVVALADLTTIATRTALSGTSVLMDMFVLCPGLHRQQEATALNGGEYPAAAAMTTGYIFRIENPATVNYLQKVGKTGSLTTLTVSGVSDGKDSKFRQWTSSIIPRLIGHKDTITFPAIIPYFFAAWLTIIFIGLLIWWEDWWGVSVLSILIFARLLNVIVVRHRSRPEWKGAREPGVEGDLLILLSQDRWIRMVGMVDDLKAVTSGQWMREMSFTEGSISALATVLVYLDAALASNVTQRGKICLMALLISSAGLLAVTNFQTEILQMHGRSIRMTGKRKEYQRRLYLAEELIHESGRRDWAVRLGMVQPEKPVRPPRARDEKTQTEDLEAAVVHL